MQEKTRLGILRANGVYLTVASTLGWIMDFAGIVLGKGPESHAIAAAPHAAVGFVEAHGLALILGITLWRVVPTRAWHITAACTVALLGTANLVFWDIFAAVGSPAMGYV